jgi:hypothetical protein
MESGARSPILGASVGVRSPAVLERRRPSASSPSPFTRRKMLAQGCCIGFSKMPESSRHGPRAMTRHFPIVLEHEPNGTVSAYVVGLPGVFAAADSEPAAASAIRLALRAHLAGLDASQARGPLSKASLRGDIQKGTAEPRGWARGAWRIVAAVAGRRRERRGSTVGRVEGLDGARTPETRTLWRVALFLPFGCHKGRLGAATSRTRRKSKIA